MLINPPRIAFRISYFHFQISIPRIHPIEILSHSDYCITTVIILKYTKYYWEGMQGFELSYYPRLFRKLP